MKLKTNKEVRETLESWAGEEISIISDADSMARYATSQLYSMINHVITIDNKYPNSTTAFDAEYILKRFKELAKLWARAQLEAHEIGSEITINVETATLNTEETETEVI